MASAPSEPRSIVGRLDKAGRLVAADPELESLQRQAGSGLGQRLTLPQVAAVAELARKLGTSVTRSAVVASTDHDIELWVQATPEGDEVVLELQGWTERAPAAPRLSALLGGASEAAPEALNEWAADEELRLISLSPELAEHLGVDVAEASGQPLTRAMRLIENESGEMPLISALAGRRAFTDQKACSRSDDHRCVVLSGEVVTAADGRFAGFRGAAAIEQVAQAKGGGSAVADFDHALEDVLRSPIDRIIESAERIVERADGPLRTDYASYGTDIAAAARHLLSVVRSMSEDPAHGHRTIDLAALAAEAVVMVESVGRGAECLDRAGDDGNASGERSGARGHPDPGEPHRQRVRHSPDGSTVRLSFDRTPASASVTVADEGPGIDPGDQQRIFERFERVQSEAGGTGLGLAISRRLARSMGGDVTLESAPGQGARFTLTLPSP